MKRFLAILVLIPILLSVLPISAMAADKPWGSVEFDGHYYRFYNTSMTYPEAKAFCEEQGGHVVTITSAEENEFVLSLFSDTYIWLGGNDEAEEGKFVWDTGEYFFYTNWDDGEPNNKGATGNQDNMLMYSWGNWDDIEGSVSYPFVCEWDKYTDDTQLTLPQDVTEFNGHSYIFIDTTLDWNAAAEFCIARGGHLVTISSMEENDFVHTLCKANNIWIGGNDSETEGTFAWITDEAMDFTNWSSGEPNDGYLRGQDYIQMYQNGLWDDEQSHNLKFFVCEWDFVCVSESGKGYTYHVWSNWVDDTPVGCENDGVQTRTCPTCKKTETQTISATGHAYSARTRVSGNAFIPPIVEEQRCIHCNGAIRYESWDMLWVPIVSAIALLIVIIVVIVKIRG